MDDVDFLMGCLSRNEMRCQLETLAQPQRPGLFGDERIGPALDEKTIGALGSNRAAEAMARFDKSQLDGQRFFFGKLDKPMGGGEPGDAAADDDNAAGHDGRGWRIDDRGSLFSILYSRSSAFIFCSITSAIIRIKVG